MLPLSAADAIKPAWDHIDRLLIAPRNWRLLLKIGFVAIFAGVSSINFGGSSFGGNNSGAGKIPNLGSIPHMPNIGPMVAAIAAIAAVLAVFLFVVWFVFFYISSRLQFVLFEIVLRSDTEVSPIWRRYGPATWRWMALRFVLVVAALACIAPVLIPSIIAFLHALPAAGQPVQDPGALIAVFFGLFVTVVFVAIIFSILHVLLHDFGLPYMALESTPMLVTFKRVFSLIAAEPGQIGLYLLLRLVLQFIAGIVIAFVLIVGALVLAIPFGIVGGAAVLLLHSAGTGSHIVMAILLVLVALAYLCLIVAAAVMMVGILVTFFQAYALYFLGGRYPLVGIHLEPFLPRIIPYPAPVPAQYPPPPSPAV